jgi:AraC-like DNA-binding protein
MESFKPGGVPSVLTKFSQLLDTTLKGHRLEIPEKYGSGYCAGFTFNEHIRMLISDYELKEDLLVKKPEDLTSVKLLFFKFQNIFSKPGFAGKAVTKMPSVLIATSRVNTDEHFAIHSNTETINIEVDVSYLDRLLGPSKRSPLLQSLLQGSPPLFFEQLVYASLQKVVDEILTETVDETFQLFFLKIKAEELICRLLMELDKRGEKQLYPLNDQDIQTIYKLKDNMLTRLDTPPVIAELAVDCGMSPSKLKRLFKQIFGYSLFNYYQQFRMKEAARLLKEEKLPVSATGYRLGFTNLSHFSRVFKEHHGMKPKQYSRCLDNYCLRAISTAP